MPKAKDVINSLVRSFGLRKDISDSEYRSMQDNFDNGDYVRCLVKVRDHFKLSMVNFRIIYIDDHDFLRGIPVKGISRGMRECIRILNKADTKMLLKKRMSMRISMPGNIPHYGTRAFTELKLELEISKSLLCESPELFLVVIAHEMSHVVLHSTYSQWKRSEKATDILVLLNGFMAMTERVCDQGINGYLTHKEVRDICKYLRSRK